MAQACGLGLLLALLLPMVGTSVPGTVVRLNKAMLNYVSETGKAPLQRALQVTVPHFLDWSGEVLQPSRVQILNVQVSRLDLNFIAGFGIRMLAAANFTFKVFRVPEPLELVLPVVLVADARVAPDSIRTPVVSISTCSSFFNNAIVLDGNHSTALLVRVQRHIKAVLRNKLCLSVSNLVQNLNVHLGTLIGLNPVGPESQIRYFMISAPNITNDYISLDISAVLFLLGKPIVLPVNATRFMLPEHVGTDSAMATVGLSQDLFDSVLLLLQKAGTLNMDITGQLVRARSAARGTDVKLTVASSNVGFIDTDQVHAQIGTVFEKPLLDHLNALLGMGIALPNVVSLYYLNAEIFVHEGYVVVSSKLLYEH
ncbi:BPI fold-containing family B member 2 [Pteropus vampyrus]|uniref:BPI fold-containing family B member 2 n=1 Tax=Pteropus vampyrus TaxID=132908 RepID=A0A6P3R7I9_PTEVA|nr:BPI fold-containing family B member 2 [Pteropus vampyrus]